MVTRLFRNQETLVRFQPEAPIQQHPQRFWEKRTIGGYYGVRSVVACTLLCESSSTGSIPVEHPKDFCATVAERPNAKDCKSFNPLVRIQPVAPLG